MKRLALFLLLMAGTADAQEDHSHHHHTAPPAGDAQIVVTINPEARVSAIVAAPLLPPGHCGDAAELKVKIVNQGAVTAPLRAKLIDNSAQLAGLHMDAAKLSGRLEDTRLLHLTPLGTAPVDLTIAFSFDDNIGDLGGRDRVHVLIRCR